MNKLTTGHFKRQGEAGSFGHYFSYKDELGYEICLEACLNGYDVAIYKDMGLVGEKECTNIEGIMPGFSAMSGEALNKAVEITNRKYSRLLKESNKNDKQN